jgi:hypothetical protein
MTYIWECNQCSAKGKIPTSRYKAKLRARQHAKRKNEQSVNVNLIDIEKNRIINITEKLSPRIVSKSIHGSVKRFYITEV